VTQKLTPSVTLWVKCDRCGTPEHWINLSVSAAFEHAKTDGWSLSSAGDLCPACAREEAN